MRSQLPVSILGLICLLLAGGFHGCARPAPPAAPQPAPLTRAPEPVFEAGSTPVDLVWMTAAPPELAAVAAPLLARLGHDGVLPGLLTGGPVEDLSSVATAPLWTRDARHLLVLGTPGEQPACPPGCQLSRVDLADGLSGQALQLASRFWGNPATVVAAAAGEPAELIAAAVLASRLGVPLIPVENAVPAPFWRDAADRLQCREIIWVGYPGKARRPAPGSCRVRVLSLEQARARAVELVAPVIPNVVLARTPGTADASPAAWLTPAYALARRSVVVLVDSPAAEAAEAAVQSDIDRFRLRPRTVTIFGPDTDIGLRDRTIRPPVVMDGVTQPSAFEVSVEPFAEPFENQALGVGVGRLPGTSLWELSRLVRAADLHRAQLRAEPPRVLLVANSNPEYGNLPLCETVSRATAAELHNLGLQVDEFYRHPTASTEVRDAAARANLIVYEGHLNDQYIFDDPGFYMDAAYAPEQAWSLAPREDSGEPAGTAIAGRDDDDEPAPLVAYGSVDDDGEEPSPGAWGNRPLDGYPLIVFQSCQSLDEEGFERLAELGASGVIGSTTNIHSASGSVFVMAFLDGMLYRGGNVGEALRDARNYFFCLHDLKSGRGHREQAKSYRAALSFRLWGDPEAVFAPAGLPAPRLMPVTARFEEPNRLVIDWPERRLSAVEVDGYTLRSFPGSHAAGLVKRRADDPGQRRILPLQFFRLPVPGSFTGGRFSGLRFLETPDLRAVFRVDPFDRWLYVTYFPDQEKPRDQQVLYFQP